MKFKSHWTTMFTYLGRPCDSAQTVTIFPACVSIAASLLMCMSQPYIIRRTASKSVVWQLWKLLKDNPFLENPTLIAHSGHVPRCPKLALSVPAWCEMIRIGCCIRSKWDITDSSLKGRKMRDLPTSPINLGKKKSSDVNRKGHSQVSLRVLACGGCIWFRSCYDKPRMQVYRRCKEVTLQSHPYGPRMSTAISRSIWITASAASSNTPLVPINVLKVFALPHPPSKPWASTAQAYAYVTT